MFAVEVTFPRSQAQSEMVLIRRPAALIGSTPESDLLLEDLKSSGVSLRIVRLEGRRFQSFPEGNLDPQIAALLKGTYEGAATIDAGDVRFHITALDGDCQLRDGEPPDRAGVRVLRQASSTPTPVFPAVVIRQKTPQIVSFVPDHPVYVGRSGDCVVRVDRPDISSRHARMGYESGEFWIEDLGSTNGTFVQGQQVAGRIAVSAGVPIILGRESTIVGVASPRDLEAVTELKSAAIQRPEVQARNYPALVSLSEVARPARLVLPMGSNIRIGRNPNCEMWLGAPHVSREHSEVSLSPTSVLRLKDTSTNGTQYDDGILHRGDVVSLEESPKVLDFGNDITVAICFSEEDEQRFINAGGSPMAFQMEGQILSETEFIPIESSKGRGSFEVSAVEHGPGMETLAGLPFLIRLKILYGSLGALSRFLILLVTVILMFIGVLVLVLLKNMIFV